MHFMHMQRESATERKFCMAICIRMSAAFLDFDFRYTADLPFSRLHGQPVMVQFHVPMVVLLFEVRYGCTYSAYIHVPTTVPMVVTTPNQKTDHHVMGTRVPFGNCTLNGIITSVSSDACGVYGGVSSQNSPRRHPTG